MPGFGSAHIAWNAISNLKLQRLQKALRNDLVLPFATTVCKICYREYAQTVDAVKKQLPLSNIVSLALDQWTSTNEVAIMSVIAYYIQRKWALREFQLGFNEFDHLFGCNFEH
jgi:hypothetical protein